MSELSITRLNMLRVGYLLISAGLAIVIWPRLLGPPENWPLMNTVVSSLLGGLSVIAALGLRYPVKMLPILFFEMVWKSIWMIFIAFPLWRSGDLSPGHWGTLSDFTVTLILIPLIPWRYVLSAFVTGKGDPWWRPSRNSNATT